MTANIAELEVSPAVAETVTSAPAPVPEGPCEVEIITGLDRIHAFLVRGSLAPAQRDHLYRMVPERFRLDIGLTRHWGLAAAIVDPYWAVQQKRHLPPSAPAGMRMVFVPADGGSPASATAPMPVATATFPRHD